MFDARPFSVGFDVSDAVPRNPRGNVAVVVAVLVGGGVVDGSPGSVGAWLASFLSKEPVVRAASGTGVVRGSPNV